MQQNYQRPISYLTEEEYQRIARLRSDLVSYKHLVELLLTWATFPDAAPHALAMGRELAGDILAVCTLLEEKRGTCE